MSHELHAALAQQILGAVRVLQLHGANNRAVHAAIERLRATLAALFAGDGHALSIQVVDRFVLVDGQLLPDNTSREDVAESFRRVLGERGIGGLCFRAVPDEGALTTWLSALARPVQSEEDGELVRAQLRALRDLGIDALDPKTIARVDDIAEVDVTSLRHALELYARTVVGTAELIDALAAGREPFSGRINVIRTVQELIDIACASPESLLEVLERERLRGIELEEPYAVVHAANTCVWAILIGRTLDLDRHRMLELGISALLADVGFALVPDELHNQPRALDRSEQETLRLAMIRATQALVGGGRVSAEMMRRAVVAYEHHQLLADPVTGESTHPYSRIVAVADVFDALTHSREWREAMSMSQAIAVLSGGAGVKFDALAVTALSAVLRADRS